MRQNKTSIFPMGQSLGCDCNLLFITSKSIHHNNYLLKGQDTVSILYYLLWWLLWWCSGAKVIDQHNCPQKPYWRKLTVLLTTCGSWKSSKTQYILGLQGVSKAVSRAWAKHFISAKMDKMHAPYHSWRVFWHHHTFIFF